MGRRLASMEGRAIARPNRHRVYHGARGHRRASMEGRAIARPNADASPRYSRRLGPLQWRAEQLPGQNASPRSAVIDDAPLLLQWRAEQLPGQTCRTRAEVLLGVHLASMEGRAIARPNYTVLSPLCGAVIALQWRAEQLPGQTPLPHSFRVTRGGVELQWRAEQLPGQTRKLPPGFGYRWRIHASMEGRAIARPNLSPTSMGIRPLASMEGRVVPETRSLQWRAEQLPGQTVAPPSFTQ